MSSHWDLLLPQAPQPAKPPFEWATVTSISPLRITVDGPDGGSPIDGTPINCASGLTVGSRVVAAKVGTALTIIGKVQAAGGAAAMSAPVSPLAQSFETESLDALVETHENATT